MVVFVFHGSKPKSNEDLCPALKASSSIKSVASSPELLVTFVHNAIFKNDGKKKKVVTFYQLPVSALSVTLVILLLAHLKITLAFLNVFGNLATVVKWRSVCCFPCQWMLFSSISYFSFALNVCLKNLIKIDTKSYVYLQKHICIY